MLHVNETMNVLKYHGEGMHAAEALDTTTKLKSKWLPAVGWPLLLLVICCGMFWKLLLPGQYSFLESPDLAYQVLPWLQQQARDWHQGHIPLWDPYLWGGQPLLAQAQPGVAYPFNWLLFLAPLKNGFIQLQFVHWYFVLIHFQAALFCYWLCRDLKRSHAASLLSGVAFALGGFIGTIDWPQHLNSALWAPLIVMFFLRSMRGDRPIANAACSGALLGFSLLGGHHQLPIFVGLMMVGLWVYFLALDRQKLKLLFIFGCFAFLVSGIQALPSFEYGHLALRWVNAANAVGWKDKVPYVVHQEFSFYPESIFGIVFPGMFRHTDPYVGLVAVALALIGLGSNWIDRNVRLFGAIAAGGILFSLGANSVFHGVIYALVPMVEKARNPSMAIFIFHFGLCILICYGVDGYVSSEKMFAKRLCQTLVIFAAVVASLIAALTMAKVPIDSRMGIPVIAGLLLASILAAWRSGHISFPEATGLLALLMLLELGNTTTYGYPPQALSSRLKEISQHDDIAAFLNHQNEVARVEVEQKDIAYNFGDWYGIDQMGGYLPSLTENVTRVQGGKAARMLYATNYFIGRQPSRPDQIELFTGKSGLKVYRNPSALPRVRVVHQALGIRADNQIVPLMESAEFDARRQTFLKGAIPQLETCDAPETVTLVNHFSGVVTIDAVLQCRGMVIDADTYYPGWVASVDGKPTAIYEAYGFLRGVVVEAGRHRIELAYRPKSVYWGAGLSALGILGAIGLRFLA